MSVTAELDDASPGRIVLETMYKHSTLAKTIPGVRPDPASGNQFTATLSWASCLALRTVFGDDLEIGPKLAEWANNEYATRVGPCLALREATDAEGDPTLYPYQRAGVKFLTLAQRALLCDGLGAGKTRQALTTLRNIYEEGDNPFPALIICPNSTKIAWKREAELVWPGLKVVVIDGSSVQRRKQIEEPAHIYVINWEAIRSHSRLAPYGSVALKKCLDCGGVDEKITETKCQAHDKELNAIEFRTVIADEVHRAKEAVAAQTRALKAVSKAAKYRLGLTGTPIANAPDDLWSILNWLSPEEWPSKTKFIDRMCDVSYNAFGAAEVIGIKKQMEKEFFGAFDPRMRRMPKDLVLQHLPPVLYERRDVEMNPKQKKAYEQLRDQMAAEIDGEVYVVLDQRIKMMRLLQFASSYAELETVLVKVTDEETGAVREEERVHVRLSDPSCKLDAFMDDLHDYDGQSVAVFAASRQLIELLSARLEKKGIAHGLITGAQDTYERQHHMDNFQAGKTRFILCTTGAGGTGITLTKASTAVFLQRPWSMIDSEQAEGRVHRIGSDQHEKITIVDYVTEGTVEDYVLKTVQEKSDRLETILRDKDLLRKLLDKPVAEKKVTRRKPKKKEEDDV